jgi:dolichyl-phosphate beta-glucosyltransferase
LDTPSSSIDSTSRRSEFLSVIVPAYNEERRLGDTLKRTHDYLRARFQRFEILVVNDGSTDRTGEVVDAFAKQAPEVELVQLRENSGKGCAVRTGMLAAEGDYVLFSDADLSTPIEEVEKALALMAKGYDVVIASRALPESDVQVHQNFLRETMGKTFNRVVRLFSRLPFPDTQCGFKCFTREAAQDVFSRALINGFAFDVEALVLARKLGYRMADFPVRWINSPDSRVRIFSSPLQMLWEVVKVRVNLIRGRYNSAK